MRLGTEPGAQQQVAAVVTTVVRGHGPPMDGLVEQRGGHRGPEVDVAGKVEDIDDMVEVGHQFVTAGKTFGPRPVAPDLLE